jgi:hypothetical protein
METTSDVLMLSGVAAHCADCDGERVLIPVDDRGGEFCCTTCDAAVFLVEAVHHRGAPPAHRAA